MTTRTREQLLATITPLVPASWTDEQLTDLVDSVVLNNEEVLVALVAETYSTTSEDLQESDELRFAVKEREMWWFETTVLFRQQNGNTGTIGYTGAELQAIHWTYVTGPAATAYLPLEPGGARQAFNEPVAIGILENANDDGILNMVRYEGMFIVAEDGEFIFAYAHGPGGSDPLAIINGTHMRGRRLGLTEPA